MNQLLAAIVQEICPKNYIIENNKDYLCFYHAEYPNQRYYGTIFTLHLLNATAVCLENHDHHTDSPVIDLCNPECINMLTNFITAADPMGDGCLLPNCI